MSWLSQPSAAKSTIFARSLMLFRPYIERNIVRAQGMSGGHASGRSSATKEAIQANIARAVEQFGRDRLYYMHKLEYYRLPIYLRFGLEPILYFPSLTTAFTEADIQRVILELRERARSSLPDARISLRRYLWAGPRPTGCCS